MRDGYRRRRDIRGRPATREARPSSPLVVLIPVLAVVIGVVLVSSSRDPYSKGAAPTATVAAGSGRGRTVSSLSSPAGRASGHGQHHASPAGSKPPKSRRPSSTQTLARAVGQLIIGTYAGVHPPALMLTAVRRGQLGAVILMGTNTAGGFASTRAATTELQSAARAGGNPGLLVMTDQEGGEVKRLPGAPDTSAAAMGASSTAAAQGAATARVLLAAGVNVDLAPVADVSRTNGFMTQEQRTFGSSPHVVAHDACAFAGALARRGIAYTLKHFPGLGDATSNTDGAPVTVAESAAMLAADDAAYRQCGRNPLALVMVSSASYSSLTGTVPAVLSPSVYRTLLPRYGVSALPISDSFESGAISHLTSPAMRAINAGLDMVMYPDYESTSAQGYEVLVDDAKSGALSQRRVRAAAARVLELKHSLHLG